MKKLKSLFFLTSLFTVPFLFSVEEAEAKSCRSTGHYTTTGVYLCDGHPGSTCYYPCGAGIQ